MGAMASQVTSLTTVYSTVYSGADQRKQQCSASLAFVRGIHRSPVNSPHKEPVTREMFPFDDVFMLGICKGWRQVIILTKNDLLSTFILFMPQCVTQLLQTISFSSLNDVTITLSTDYDSRLTRAHRDFNWSKDTWGTEWLVRSSASQCYWLPICQRYYESGTAMTLCVLHTAKYMEYIVQSAQIRKTINS